MFQVVFDEPCTFSVLLLLLFVCCFVFVFWFLRVCVRAASASYHQEGLRDCELF